MSIYALEPRQASACPLEAFKDQLRAALKLSQITLPQALVAVADELAERAGGSAILADLADRVSQSVAQWALDWGLDDGVVDDDLVAWVSNEAAISSTVIIVN
jgi:hypothetical protein